MLNEEKPHGSVPPSMAERVVITGLSCISPFGVGREAFTSAVASGACGVAPITSFGTDGCASHTAATVRGFDPSAFIPPLKLRRVDAVGRLALAGTRLLLEDAGRLDSQRGPDKRDNSEIGVALGTSTAGLDSLVEYMTGLTDGGPTGVPAIIFSNTVSNAPASLCAIEFGLRGPNVTFNQREASSFGALAYSVAAIRQHRVTSMITGGADFVEEIFFKVQDRFRALSPLPRSCSSEGARPFDERRNGHVLGEGAFLLLLESLSSARARGAPVYGEVLGIGATSARAVINGWPDDCSALVRAMELALSQAGVNPNDVAAVLATANGSPRLDELEARAIARVFDGRPVPVASVKGAVGESGASACAALITGLFSIPAATVVPTVGYEQPDPISKVSVSSGPQRATGDTFIVNSVASGGAHYCVAVRAAALPA